MPAVDAPRGGNKYAKPTPPPKPPAPPPPSRITSSVPHGSGVISVGRPAPPRPASAYIAPPPRQVVPDATPHGRGTLTKVTPGSTQPQSAYANPQSYAKTVLQVFKAQPPAQQRAVIQGALKNPDTAESKILLQHLQAFPGQASQYAQTPKGILPALGKMLSPSSVYGPRSAGADAAGAPKGDFGAVMFGGPKEAPKLLANAGKDVVNLPAETLATAGTLGGDVVGGHPMKAIHDFINPFVQLAEHPGQSFYTHPVDSYLMATGALHGATRLAAAPARALASEGSTVGRALSTNREGVALTGKLTHERPAYSKSPTIKAQQVGLEKGRYTRAPTGELVPRSESVRAKLLKKGVGELVGTQERIRRVNRDITRAVRERQITPSLARRAGKAAKRTLAYGSKQAVIPGADVLARIADGTIRRPDTIAQDIATHLRQVSANRPNLLGDVKGLKAHDAYVKQLAAAVNDKAFLKNPAPAFKAASEYGKDYPIVQAQAKGFGHFGTMTDELLQRRALAHYAITHMGATMDEAKGLVDANGDPLSNQAIVAHLKGPDGTGGRMPAFTSDRPRFDAAKDARKANYVSSARRPLPAVQKNTMYAYTHGLTEAGHSGLTEQHVLMQGVVDSHRAQNAYLDTLATQKPGGGYWSSYDAAKGDAPKGYTPINTSQAFHPQDALDQALEGANPASIEEEAVRRSLDLNARTQPGTKGRWAIIDDRALKALNDHQNQISPNTMLRTIRSLNNQFRTVALSTSAKHIPGVAQENLLRDIAHGVGFRSWVSGRRIVSRMEDMRPVEGRNFRTSQTGGQLAGMTEAGKTYAVSDHWVGTSVHPVLRAMEATFKAPGPRQLRTAWRAWTKFAIGTTKHLLEQQHQIAGIGKAALREHGYAEAAKVDGFMGLAHRAFGLHGRMLDDAAKGLFDPAKARQMRATINQMYGKWTDFGPSAQTALMFSPFGLWWINSAKFLARAPVDMPVKTAALAGATVGTEQERQAKGLDMFSPGHLPLYEQGGIPVGGKILAQNYYSPMGIANDPAATAVSLLEPWAATPLNTMAFGINWLGKPLTAPGQNTNRGNQKDPSMTQKAQYVLDSVLASFVPLYTKAEQTAAGGASAYDVSPGGVVPPLARGKSPATKAPGKGPSAGLGKALLPVREYKIAGSQGSYKLGGGTQSSGGGSYVLGSGGQSSGGGGYVLGSGG